MKKFIYVFNEQAKNELIEAGFKMLKSDDRSSTYIFVNKDKDKYPSVKFALNKVSYIESDTLTF